MNQEIVYLCSTIVGRIESTCSGETDMNLQDSLLNHENRNEHDETPPRGLFGGGGNHRAWKSVKKISYHS